MKYNKTETELNEDFFKSLSNSLFKTLKIKNVDNDVFSKYSNEIKGEIDKIFKAINNMTEEEFEKEDDKNVNEVCDEMNEIGDNKIHSNICNYPCNVKGADVVSESISKEKQQKEMVNHPDHYNSNGIEVIDIIEEYHLNFHIGNVVKYILRCGKKDEAIQELKKALWYLNREIEHIKKYEHLALNGAKLDNDGGFYWMFKNKISVSSIIEKFNINSRLTNVIMICLKDALVLMCDDDRIEQLNIASKYLEEEIKNRENQKS